MSLSVLSCGRGEQRNNGYRHINLCRNASFIRSLKTHVKSIDFLAPLNIWVLEVWTMGCSLKNLLWSFWCKAGFMNLCCMICRETSAYGQYLGGHSIVIYSTTTNRRKLGELWKSHYKKYWRGVEIIGLGELKFQRWKSPL